MVSVMGNKEGGQYWKDPWDKMCSYSSTMCTERPRGTPYQDTDSLDCFTYLVPLPLPSLLCTQPHPPPHFIIGPVDGGGTDEMGGAGGLVGCLSRSWPPRALLTVPAGVREPHRSISGHFPGFQVMIRDKDDGDVNARFVPLFVKDESHTLPLETSEGGYTQQRRGLGMHGGPTYHPARQLVFAPPQLLGDGRRRRLVGQKGWAAEQIERGEGVLPDEVRGETLVYG